jgi:TPR repeat protein
MNKMAEYNVAVCYMDGRGTKQDMEKCASLAWRSARQGFPDAEYLMGALSEHAGKYEDANEWYRKAALHGNSKAKIELARRGITID